MSGPLCKTKASKTEAKRIFKTLYTIHLNFSKKTLLSNDNNWKLVLRLAEKMYRVDLWLAKKVADDQKFPIHSSTLLFEKYDFRKTRCFQPLDCQMILAFLEYMNH